MDETTGNLPPHVERTVHAIAFLDVDHQRQATPVEDMVDRATAMLGSLGFLIVLSLILVLWIGVNLGLLAAGRAPVDPPPFPLLETGLSVGALYIGTLILITQKRAGRLATRREQMALELGMMSEQKAAKIIELIEELRSDSPDVKNRVDKEATAMATPIDPHEVLEAITDTCKTASESKASDG